MQASLVTVTYSGDLRLTCLQALSIDRLFRLSDISEYVIVINDPCAEVVEQEIRTFLNSAVSAELCAKTKFLSWEDFYLPSDRIGHFDQQCLKLEVSRLVESEYYIVLDGKNHFVESVSGDDFFTLGVPRAGMVKTSPYWKNNVLGSMQMIDKKMPSHLAERMVESVTPFVMRTPVAVALVEFLETKFDSKLPGVLRGREGQATEFLLYYFFCLSRFGFYPYINDRISYRTIFTIYPPEPVEVDSFISEADSGEIKIFGLHRNRIDRLSNAQLSSIQEVWSHRILKDWESPEWFLQGREL